MRKTSIFVMLLAILAIAFCVSGCSDNNNGNVTDASESKLESSPSSPSSLHVFESGGYKYLADSSGKVLYSLQPPYVTIDIDRKVFVVHPTVYYAPGTSYYGATYDGFTVVYAGHPRSGVEGKTINFGPAGGEFDIPKSPYDNCYIQAFVIDSKGTKFKTDRCLLFFRRSN